MPTSQRRMISNKQLIIVPQKVKEQTKFQISKRKEIRKIWAEIQETETLKRNTKHQWNKELVL
jgi:hypothetical protein